MGAHVIDAEAPLEGTKAQQDAYVAKWEPKVAEAIKHLKKTPRRMAFTELEELCERERSAYISS